MARRRPELIPPGAAPLFAALGDPVRLALIGRLGDGRPRSIVELTEGTGLTRQGISKHLGVLERAGLVDTGRLGRESRITLRPAGLDEARRHLERASAQWDGAVARLKALLEER
jgi:DNA-binding transcriptional ArsR family regulator